MNRRSLLLRTLPGLLLAASGGISGRAVTRGAAASAADDSDQQLWDRTVGRYMDLDLWTDRYAYNAGHFLMVPLHAAFLEGHHGWQQQFVSHFRRFAQAGFPGPMADGNRLKRLQYLYLLSRFAVLAAESGAAALVEPGLVGLLYETVQAVWQVQPAWQWDREPFPGGMRERLAWKLSDPVTAYRFYRALIDDDMFIFAIAADLRAYERRTGQTNRWSAPLPEILQMAQRALRARVVPTAAGGWLFQPGIWSDHPSNAYAGAPAKPPLAPAPLADVAEDSSHSHRWPLWLSSLTGAYGDGAPEQAYYRGLSAGLEQQLFQRVLVAPTADFPGYRMTNYMDGRNGVLLWNYTSLGPGYGYGPYEKSGTLLLGWWSFLQTDRIADVYEDIADQFPLPAPVLGLYTAVTTPVDTGGVVPSQSLTGASYTNGFRELIVRLAARTISELPD